MPTLDQTIAASISIYIAKARFGSNLLVVINSSVETLPKAESLPRRLPLQLQKL